jgi:hypothetical protein
MPHFHLRASKSVKASNPARNDDFAADLFNLTSDDDGPMPDDDCPTTDAEWDEFRPERDITAQLGFDLRAERFAD